MQRRNPCYDLCDCKTSSYVKTKQVSGDIYWPFFAMENTLSLDQRVPYLEGVECLTYASFITQINPKEDDQLFVLFL